MFAGAMLVAMAIDAGVGWPRPILSAIGHPVIWLGRAISWLDRTLNREEDTDDRRQMMGVVAALGLIVAVWIVAELVQRILPDNWFGVLLTGVLAWPLVATRSMYDHVAAVARPLACADLPEARRQVARIVGRDVTRLDEAGVSRAALESLAENTSDGIVAPLFWGLIFGLPGIAAYKTINTLDSMIGHRTPRHEAFGWAAARIDDVVNLIPARLTGALFALVSTRRKDAFAVMKRDARLHRSPNAGWPESAMAGALHIRLSGPRVYADRVAEEPWVNEGAPDPRPGDITRGLQLFKSAMLAVAGGLFLLAVVV